MELHAKEQEEIQVILANLSTMAAEHSDEIRVDYEMLTNLDFIFARGSFAVDLNGSRPVFNQEGRIHIREGRHPLLDKARVVPTTIRLGDEFDGAEYRRKDRLFEDNRTVYSYGSGGTSHSGA